MALHMLQTCFALALILCINMTSIMCKLVCEELPVEACAFAVGSSGARCLLESRVLTNGALRYECQSSMVMAENFEEWVETDECIDACGLERLSVGLSTDYLTESDLTHKLCSFECQNNCPNIFDLYTNLAAGEGVHLPYVCETLKNKSRILIGGTDFVWASQSANTMEEWFSTLMASAPVPAPAIFG